MDRLLISSRPDREPIRELHVWIAVDPETGGEGLLSADMSLPVPDETHVAMRHMPLMSSSREVALSLRPLAEALQRKALAETGFPVRVELRSYTYGEP